MTIGQILDEAAALLHWWNDQENGLATDAQIQAAAERGEEIAQQLDQLAAANSDRGIHIWLTPCPKCGYMVPTHRNEPWTSTP